MTKKYGKDLTDKVRVWNSPLKSKVLYIIPHKNKIHDNVEGNTTYTSTVKTGKRRGKIGAKVLRNNHIRRREHISGTGRLNK